MGLQALAKIIKEEGILSDKFIGTVMENIELCDPSFWTAVEVAAENSLHYVNVETD